MLRDYIGTAGDHFCSKIGGIGSGTVYVPYHGPGFPSALQADGYWVNVGS